MGQRTRAFWLAHVGREEKQEANILSRPPELDPDFCVCDFIFVFHKIENEAS